MNLDPKALADFLRHIASAIDAYQPPVGYTDLNKLRQDVGLEPPSPTAAPKPKEIKLADLQALAKEIIITGRRDELKAYLDLAGVKGLSSISSDLYPSVQTALNQILATDDGPQ
jgi:hypothetical protein